MFILNILLLYADCKKKSEKSPLFGTAPEKMSTLFDKWGGRDILLPAGLSRRIFCCNLSFKEGLI